MITVVFLRTLHRFNNDFHWFKRKYPNTLGCNLIALNICWSSLSKLFTPLNVYCECDTCVIKDKVLLKGLKICCLLYNMQIIHNMFSTITPITFGCGLAQTPYSFRPFMSLVLLLMIFETRIIFFRTYVFTKLNLSITRI